MLKLHSCGISPGSSPPGLLHGATSGPAADAADAQAASQPGSHQADGAEVLQADGEVLQRGEKQDCSEVSKKIGGGIHGYTPSCFSRIHFFDVPF